MIRAYDEMYLREARTVLASSIDYAVNTLEYGIEDFYGMFVRSDIADRFERGDPFVVSGMSGIELALLVVEKATGKSEFREKKISREKSREYWAGWSVAFYQWYSSCSFRMLQAAVPISRVLDMYDKYHEMDIMHFVERVDEMQRLARITCYLQEIRKLRGFSQSELAKCTGIPIRTLQHYEQGSKSLSAANATYVIKLAKALNCAPEALLA